MSRWHLLILEEGYKLQFTELPPPSVRPNNRSARLEEHFEFVCTALKDHLKVGAVKEVEEEPFLVMPLQVVAPVGRKKRLITDPSIQLNPYLKQYQVKLDNLSVVASSIERNSWFGVMDLSSGYYHLRIHEPHQKYLGFAWTGTDHVRRYYVWTIAFLGLSPLVQVFTKFQKPIIAFLRSQGIQCFIYIDDMIIFGKSKEECQTNMEIAREAWRQAGWIENEAKAKAPTQFGEYLGLVLNTISLTIHIPQNKKDSLVALCYKVAKHKRMHIRELAGVYGKILASLLATGPQLLLLTRTGLKTIASGSSWEVILNIEHLQPELHYLAENLHSLDGFPIENEHNKVATSCIQTASDASGQAVALVKITCNQKVNHLHHEGKCGFMLEQETFNLEEKTLSSTWREMRGLSLLIKTQGCDLRRKTVVHWTDSKNVERIMLKGSSITELQNLALSVYQGAKSNYIDLRVIWRPRSDPRLKLADDFSRAVDIEDYGIDDDSFAYLQFLACKKFDFDVFASDANNRVSSFSSVLASNRALFRDAFTHSWSGLGFAYLHPPVNLIGPSIRKIVADRAKGILILPFWRTMADWLLVCADGTHFNNVFIRGTAIRPCYRKGEQVISPTFEGYTKFATFALEFRGDVKDPLTSRVAKSACSKGGCKKCFSLIF